MFEMYRHSIYNHAEAGEVAISRPVSIPVDTDTTPTEEAA